MVCDMSETVCGASDEPGTPHAVCVCLWSRSWPDTAPTHRHSHTMHAYHAPHPRQPTVSSRPTNTMPASSSLGTRSGFTSYLRVQGLGFLGFRVWEGLWVEGLRGPGYGEWGRGKGFKGCSLCGLWGPLAQRLQCGQCGQCVRCGQGPSSQAEPCPHQTLAGPTCAKTQTLGHSKP